MKNVKKLLKKAMVFTLAASMLVGTPLTASAAGIRGVYSISDGDKTVGGNPNDSGTGTVTNTNTDTGSGVLRDNDAAIIGIVLDKDIVNAEKDQTVTLKATVVLDESSIAAGNDVEEVRKALEKKIRWELSNADDPEDGTKVRNPAAYVGISTPNGAADRTVVKLNPKKGTKKGEEVVVTASIDGSLYLVKDANGKFVVKERKDKFEDYTASATVSVKEYSTGFKFFDLPEKAFVKHTINMNEHVQRIPETANDDITWVSTNTKAATVTAAGVVTFKKVGESGKIIAVGERGAQEEWDFGKVDAGTPASKVVIVRGDNDQAFTKNTTTVDLNSGIENQEGWTGNSNDVEVQVYAKIKKAKIDAEGNVIKKNDKVQTETKDVLEGDEYYDADGNLVPEGSWTVTDDIVWSSSKDAFASVEADSGNDRSATITANGVGTATITAKASSGKSSKLKVVVKATLADIWIAEYENGPRLSDPGLYSGQSMQLYVGRDPEENKDAVKWSIEKVQEIKNGEPQYKGDKPKLITNPNATINAKGVLTIKAKVDTTYPVTVKLEPKKKVVNSTTGEELYDTVEFQVEQASIEEITVTEDGYSAPIARVSLNAKGKLVQNDGVDKSANTREIAIPKNKTYTAAVVASAGYDNYVGAADILTWKSSNAKVAELTPDRGGNVKITAKATGTSTITVSGIRVTTNAKNGKETASVIKTTFKVSVKQPVKTVTLNKPSVVLNQKEKKVKGNNEVQDQKVALKATLGPKGVNAKKEAITWTVKQTAGSTDHSEALKDLVALGLQNKKTGAPITSASVSVNLPKPVVGDEFEITARTKSGASATTTVKIVKTTTGVEIREKGASAFNKNTKEIPFGGSVSIETYINTAAKGQTADWALAGTDTREDVTYSVNKKGIVSIDNDGTIHAINSGTVTITAKTPLNKKATLKVTVGKPVTN